MALCGLSEQEVLQEQVDKLVDRVGVAAVLIAIGEIAHERSERARLDWVNKQVAGRWTALAKFVNELAPSALGL
jgi:hypothetical protein